ncbi:peptidase C14, caspase domain-containing protein [Rhodofomes roseus]|uniref:Peptidase C14, caspase domain-containing protein n=1 Tax=Rhodofomes roseus TaxID=34475 RepID=A0ABQ8KEJ4_9APHY|nr:peptidase C14, caspase domain-containing protein [Rhodofomes roseus]KAH9836141.1 peptidase C14, caspase domain-containing protein [Rhodofomes roseus]
MRPKRANIKRELLELVKDPIPGDTLFFFYAGHVGQLTCDEHSETDGQDEALIPADAVRPWECLHIPAESLRQIDHGSWLKDNELKKILVNDLPHGVRLVCVVDACHSGTLFDLPHGPCNTAQIAAARRLRTYLPDIPHLSRPSSRASLLRPEIVCKNAFCPRRPAVTTATTSSIDIVTNPNFRGKENVRMIATADDRRDGVPGRRNSSHDSCHMHCSCRSFQDSESSQILGGADANTSFDSEWPMSSFRFMGRSEPDAFQCESPTVMLPLLSEVEQPCGESCKVDPDFMGPHIVTISACMDDQEAWENKKTGGSLTQILVPYLKQHRKPTYRALMEHTNNKLDNIVHNVHKRYRRNLVSGVYYPQGGPYHGPAYQDPQLCSLTPLDLDELFIL